MNVMESPTDLARGELGEHGHGEALVLCVQRRGDSASAERFLFDQGFAVAGSASACHLRLDDPSVPARACYVQQLARRAVIVPLAGKIGGGPTLHALYHLPAAAPVIVGPFQIWRPAAESSNGDGLPEAEEPLLLPFPEPIAAWEIGNVKGEVGAAKARHLRHALTLVGSGPACRFRMVHPTIAEIHASLVYDRGQLQVIDLASEHGVYVNGQRVASAALKDGDELRIGHCRGVIRGLDSTPRMDAAPPAAVSPEPAEPLAAQVPYPAAHDGIVVSLSNAGPEVRESPAPPTEEFAPEPRPYSEEHCLTLVTQFLEMQQSVLEQTQRLMEKISERLATESGQSNADEAPPAPVEVEPVVPAPTDVSSAPTVRKNRPQRQAAELIHSAPAPEFHAWLTRQLSELESSQRSGFSRLWNRLTGQK